MKRSVFLSQQQFLEPRPKNSDSARMQYKREPTKDASPPATDTELGRREPSPSGSGGGPRSIATLHQMPPPGRARKGERCQAGSTRRKRSSEIVTPEAQLQNPVHCQEIIKEKTSQNRDKIRSRNQSLKTLIPPGSNEGENQ